MQVQGDKLSAKCHRAVDTINSTISIHPQGAARRSLIVDKHRSTIMFRRSAVPPVRDRERFGRRTGLFGSIKPMMQRASFVGSRRLQRPCRLVVCSWRELGGEITPLKHKVKKQQRVDDDARFFFCYLTRCLTIDSNSRKVCPGYLWWSSSAPYSPRKGALCLPALKYLRGT